MPRKPASENVVCLRRLLNILANFSNLVLHVTGEKMEITFFPDRGSNPVRWTQSPTLYHVAIKAGLYRKAVQVYHIPTPGDILPLQLEIRP